MNIPEFSEIIEPNDQTEARQAHLEKLRELVGNVYPNKYDRSKISGAEDTISNVLRYEPIAEVVKEIKAHIAALGEGEKPNPELKESLNAKLKELGNVRVSGRLTTTPRTMGKAAFVHLSDGVCRLQIYVRRDDIKGVANDGSDSEVNGWDLFKLLDGGDFIGVGGFIFLTNTGELSVHVETLQFLSKAMLPLPDKMHGIADPELQRRYRYADLIASSLQIEHDGLTTREVFERRAKLISGMRRFLDDHDYIEVETPMLTPKATGAAAKPFATHHNALDIALYARIAPELYLKRLTVGGFEKVYELNRNFRNEGLSNRHNPEFTMLEFYCAYMDVNGMMDFAEELLKHSVYKAKGDLQVQFANQLISFGTFDLLPNGDVQFNNREFERLAMRDAILKYVPSEFERLTTEKFKESHLDNPTMLLAMSKLFKYGQGIVSVANKPLALSGIFQDFKNYDEFLVYVKENTGKEYTDKGTSGLMITWFWKNIILPISVEKTAYNDAENNIRLMVDIFENAVESHLIQPTFIIDYPKSISPLSKASPENPQIAERFELFINGMECANGFSELNDPQEQYERFADQMKERETGDEEAMVLDEDYIRALAYGMPPAAGIGIGIDRLVMLLTNKHSIRDVILFPHLRPERREHEKEEAQAAE